MAGKELSQQYVYAAQTVTNFELSLPGERSPCRKSAEAAIITWRLKMST